MRPNFYRLVCATALMAIAGALYGDPPNYIFGTYTRLTSTCGWGGPGGADRNVRDCSGVYEDKLEVAPSFALDRSSSDSVQVLFGLHFDLGQNYFCVFHGQGTWANGRVLLNQSDKPLNPDKTNSACRLTLSFSNGMVRLSDPGQKCEPSICIGPAKLNGISYKKENNQAK